MNVIEATGLTKYYGAKFSIKNLTFSVEQGDMFGVCGAKGSGKSTLVHTLLAFLKPTGGTASIFDKDCVKYSRQIAKDIGYIPAEPAYYDYMNVKDLMRYSESFYKKKCTQRMEYLCEVLKIDPSSKIDRLSDGDRKKVCVIQGLLHNPELIILDEPSKGLEPEMKQDVFTLLQQENAKGLTVFFTTESLSEMQKLSTSAVILKEGTIIHRETPATLRKSRYKTITLETAHPVIKEFFEMLGAENISTVGKKTSFIYKGGVMQLMNKLTDLPVIDITIDDPSLNDVFKHYYREDRQMFVFPDEE